MPGTYEIDQKHNLIKTRSNGVVTVDDKITQDEAIIADPKFKMNMDVICDLTGAVYEWDLKEIDKFRSYVRRIGSLIGKSKWAVIAAGGATEHSAKIFSVLQESRDNNVKVKVFSDHKKAMDWLQGKS